MLELEKVSTYYGKIIALHEISLHVRAGEIVAILGANGAGKTTTLRTISGLLRPRGGRIKFKGRDIGRWTPDRIVRLGLGHCPEGRQLFPEMSVYENLEVGAYTRVDDLRPDLERIFELFPFLRERRDQRAGSLSGGEQQMLAIGRTLMSNPELILFDEPSLGLAPLLVQEVTRSIRTLNAAQKTVLLVEQDVQVAFTIAQRGYVLENGRIVLEGSMSELARSDRVKRAYLGG
jgi:branched-chain amino acid transport system ATP-binding protein